MNNSVKKHNKCANSSFYAFKLKSHRIVNSFVRANSCEITPPLTRRTRKNGFLFLQSLIKKHKSGRSVFKSKVELKIIAYDVYELLPL